MPLFASVLIGLGALILAIVVIVTAVLITRRIVDHLDGYQPGYEGLPRRVRDADATQILSFTQEFPTVVVPSVDWLTNEFQIDRKLLDRYSHKLPGRHAVLA